MTASSRESPLQILVGIGELYYTNELILSACFISIFSLIYSIIFVLLLKKFELPWQVNMKMTPVAHQPLDKSGSKEALSHSYFCTLAYSHQNSPSGR